METRQKDNIVLIHGDCMDYMRSLPDNAFDLAIVDPPYSKAGGSVGRTGGTWAAKYGTSIRNWDIAPSDEYFRELFRVSRNQIIWGGQLFQSASDTMLPYLAQAVYLREFHYGDGRICVDFF